jgi:hypothetical protein
VRKRFRLVQLEEVAERIVQEGPVAGAGRGREPVHLDALLLQIDYHGIDVSTRIANWFARAAGCRLLSGAPAGRRRPASTPGQDRARQLRHAEHVAIEGETLPRVGDADGDMV